MFEYVYTRCLKRKKEYLVKQVQINKREQVTIPRLSPSHYISNRPFSIPPLTQGALKLCRVYINLSCGLIKPHLSPWVNPTGEKPHGSAGRVLPYMLSIATIPIASQYYSNSSHPKGLVRISAVWSAEETWSMQISPLFLASRIKWCLMLMCFILSWYFRLLTSFWAPWLSTNIVTGLHLH